MEAMPQTEQQSSPKIEAEVSGAGAHGKPGQKRITFVRPQLYPKQFAAIYDDHRYSVIEATTKAGKTWGCIVWLLEQGIKCRKGQNVWWVAPVFSVAKIAFRRLKLALPQGIFTANEAEMKIDLINGVTIWFKSGDNPDSLYGEDVYAVVIDEATRCKEESWHAIRSTLTATRGPIRIIGNVKGRKNWAYKLARKAQSGDADMAYHKITAKDAVDAGILASEEIDDARGKLPDAVFKQLYFAEPADDEGNPFGLDAIRRCIAPLSAKPPVAFGWDLAKSVDWTVGVGIDRDDYVSALDRFQLPWNDTTPRITQRTGRMAALVDSTGVGDPILEALQRSGGSFEGYKFTSESKQRLMEGLALAIHQGKIHFPDGPIVQELECFEYEYTRTGTRYSAPEGMHDDCVCALALAVEMRRRSPFGMQFEARPLIHDRAHKEMHEEGVLV
jgi:hypothetical protein